MQTDHYELLYIMSSTYTSDELKPIVEKVASLIKEQGGEINKDDDLSKQKLAYPIKNQTHGYYRVYEFEMPKTNLKPLNDGLSLTNELLRFLIVKKKFKTTEDIAKEQALQDKLAKKKEQKIDEIKAKKQEEIEKPAEKEKEGKISLEDLDKKLDEILDTDDIL